MNHFPAIPLLDHRPYDRIREFYSVKPHRTEPVGLVYLWPS